MGRTQLLPSFSTQQAQLWLPYYLIWRRRVRAPPPRRCRRKIVTLSGTRRLLLRTFSFEHMPARDETACLGSRDPFPELFGIGRLPRQTGAHSSRAFLSYSSR